MPRILFVLFTTVSMINQRRWGLLGHTLPRKEIFSYWRCSWHVVASNPVLCWRTVSLQENFPFICVSHEYYFSFPPRSNRPPRKSFLPGYHWLRHGPVASVSKSSVLLGGRSWVQIQDQTRNQMALATQWGHTRATHHTLFANSREHRFQYWSLPKLTWRTKARVQRTDRQENSWLTEQNTSFFTENSWPQIGPWNFTLQF